MSTTTMTPAFRRIKLALGAERGRIENAFYAARAEAAMLRQVLRQLDLQCSAAWDLLQVTGTRIPWPPAPAPLRPPTLHEAMRAVLELRNNRWIRTRDLTAEIAIRGLYIRRDGRPATTSDVSARASAYPGLFERDGYVLRLRRGLTRERLRLHPSA